MANLESKLSFKLKEYSTVHKQPKAIQRFKNLNECQFSVEDCNLWQSKHKVELELLKSKVETLVEQAEHMKTN